MPCEREFARRREDARRVSAVRSLDCAHEGCFREVHLRRDELHRLGGKIVGVENDGERVAGVRAFGEDIDDVQAMGHGCWFHGEPLPKSA